MTPKEFKQSVHAAYRQAMAATNMWVSLSDGSSHLFRDVTLFGADAGRDFVETNIAEIRNQITRKAQGKQAQLSFQPYGFGNAAIKGMRDALAELTDMEVDVNGKSVTITWARNVMDLV